jgi:hypothetical protein
MVLPYEKVPNLRRQRFCSDVEPHVNHVHNALVLGEMSSEITGSFRKQLAY